MVTASRAHVNRRLTLLPLAEQGDAMLRTMTRVNAACDALGLVAFANRCATKAELRRLAYTHIRRDFELAGAMTERAVKRVFETYKQNRHHQPTFRPHDAIVYDQHLLLWKGADRVSIPTDDGRMIVAWVCKTYQRTQDGSISGLADLIYRGGSFFLDVAIDVRDTAGQLTPIIAEPSASLFQSST